MTAARAAEVVDMEAAADDDEAAAAAGTGRRVGRTVDVDVDVDADGDGDEDEDEEAVETTKGAVAAVRAAGASVGVCSIEAEAMDNLARHRSSGYVAALKQSQYQQNRDDEHTREIHTHR